MQNRKNVDILVHIVKQFVNLPPDGSRIRLQKEGLNKLNHQFSIDTVM